MYWSVCGMGRFRKLRDVTSSLTEGDWDEQDVRDSVNSSISWRSQAKCCPPGVGKALLLRCERQGARHVDWPEVLPRPHRGTSRRELDVTCFLNLPNNENGKNRFNLSNCVLIFSSSHSPFRPASFPGPFCQPKDPGNEDFSWPHYSLTYFSVRTLPRCLTAWYAGRSTTGPSEAFTSRSYCVTCACHCWPPTCWWTGSSERNWCRGRRLPRRCSWKLWNTTWRPVSREARWPVQGPSRGHVTGSSTSSLLLAGKARASRRAAPRCATSHARTGGIRSLRQGASHMRKVRQSRTPAGIKPGFWGALSPLG